MARDLKVKKLSENAVLPKRQKAGDAGLDLTASSYEFKNGRHVYGTGIAVEIPTGFVGLIFPRSSICKYDLRLSNSVGVIDSNYRGEIKFFFENDSMWGREQLSNEEVRQYKESNPARTNAINYPKIYKVGDRIGQLIVIPYPEFECIEVDELSSTDRGSQGWGSSGV